MRETRLVSISLLPMLIHIQMPIQESDWSMNMKQIDWTFQMIRLLNIDVSASFCKTFESMNPDPDFFRSWPIRSYWFCKCLLCQTFFVGQR